MGWKLNQISHPKDKKPVAGDWWFMPWWDGIDDKKHKFTSVEYERDWKGKRSPISIRLPDGRDFAPDQIAANRTGGQGWKVTGELPNITVRASIGKILGNKTFSYHGYITNGVLSDCIEGSRYPEEENNPNYLGRGKN